MGAEDDQAKDNGNVEQCFHGSMMTEAVLVWVQEPLNYSLALAIEPPILQEEPV